MRKILILSAALCLTACATASQPGAMVPEVTNANIISSGSKLNQSVSMGTVDGGKDTNPLWTSQVSNEDFAQALEQSLAAHAMLATDNATYRLDAEMVELKQPFAGLDLTVTSTVKYTLTNVDTNIVVYENTVEEAYAAKFGDALVAAKRLQLANEGSIKSNISALLSDIIAKVDGASSPLASLTTLSSG